MAYDSKKTHNYEAKYNSNGTVKNYIADIDISDIDTDNPLSLKDDNNERLTIGNVFGGLNKIIKAIIGEFTNIRSDLGGTADEIYTMPSGQNKITVEAGKSVEYTIVNLDRLYTHGYIKCENSVYPISILQPKVKLFGKAGTEMPDPPDGYHWDPQSSSVGVNSGIYYVVLDNSDSTASKLKIHIDATDRRSSIVTNVGYNFSTAPVAYITSDSYSFSYELY